MNIFFGFDSKVYLISLVDSFVQSLQLPLHYLATRAVGTICGSAPPVTLIVGLEDFGAAVDCVRVLGETTGAALSVDEEAFGKFSGFDVKDLTRSAVAAVSGTTGPVATAADGAARATTVVLTCLAEAGLSFGPV